MTWKYCLGALAEMMATTTTVVGMAAVQQTSDLPLHSSSPFWMS
jgi:hypothetical protein